MLFGLSTHLHQFQVIKCIVYVSIPIVYDCSCAVVLVSSVVLRMSLLFLFWNRRLPSLGRSRVEHTHTHAHTYVFWNKIVPCRCMYLNLIFKVYRTFVLKLQQNRFFWVKIVRITCQYLVMFIVPSNVTY